MSKKVFKMAVGALYKERLITITPQGLVLNSQNDNNNSTFLIVLV
ncbi:MAG TPA: hypothetical protein VHO90_07565 [Bacteroidales bacterium]|nr:hypothetical protein [Bacteroidales bacterium]